MLTICRRQFDFATKRHHAEMKKQEARDEQKSRKMAVKERELFLKEFERGLITRHEYRQRVKALNHSRRSVRLSPPHHLCQMILTISNRHPGHPLPHCPCHCHCLHCHHLPHHRLPRHRLPRCHRHRLMMMMRRKSLALHQVAVALVRAMTLLEMTGCVK